MTTFISPSEAETRRIAAQVAATLKLGDVLALEGPLGSGKTVFTQALGKALGIEEPIRSPSFVLLVPYPLPKGGSFVHIDLYRLERGAEVLHLGLSDLLGKPETISVIEWAKKARQLLPAKTSWIRFEIIDEGTRKITIE